MKPSKAASPKLSSENLENTYRHPLTSRYSSPQMLELFSEHYRAQIWRELWIILAESEMELGLPVSKEQIADLKKNKTKIDLKRVRAFETNLKHDVMSHLKAYAEVAPSAEGILHLGATSAFITDNADVLLLKRGTDLILAKLSVVLGQLQTLMKKYRSLEMTGFTHFQPAQPVTLGKRLAMMAQDLVWDFQDLQMANQRLQPLGCKGTTGTQASFEELFAGDSKKVFALDDLVSKKMGFERSVPLSGQTLSRKVDVWFLQGLSNLGVSFSKMSYDLRLLQHLKEVREPFGKSQIGSSAMPYKQNPMLAERMTGLSRFLMTISWNGPLTAATQWLERSLDDSSNRRMVLPEAFLTADAILESAHRLFDGMSVDEKAISERLETYRGVFETEGEMMRGTLAGGSRQELHEKIRKRVVFGKGKAESKASASSKGKKKKLSGLSSEQVLRFDRDVLDPVLKAFGKKAKAGFSAAAV